MDADEFIRQYTCEQIRVVLREPGSFRESPAIFALSVLLSEKPGSTSGLRERFIPVLTTKGEGCDKYTNSQIILALSLLGGGAESESELVLLSRSYCSSEKDMFKSGEFYLIEKTSSAELNLEEGVAPHYMRVYLKLDGVPEILKSQQIANCRIVGIFEFPEMLKDKKLFYRKLLDSMPSEFAIAVDPKSNRISANLSLTLSSLGKREIESDLFRITKESADKYRLDKNVEEFIKVGSNLKGAAKMKIVHPPISKYLT